jgi:uncharacterized surface protein with fasciclin (FAS1) repeats
VPTLNGANVTVHVFEDRRGKTVIVDDARVIAADNLASNGVVHIIDRVLLPVALPAPAAATVTAAKPVKALRGY